MKTISLEPINRRPQIHTNERVLDALLAEQVDVLMACGGKGRCATCHVYVEDGLGALSPMTDRERRTLERVSGCSGNSRLACQARVLQEGVKVRLPKGMYVTKAADAADLVGKRAQMDILHPITGEVLVQEGKLITRTFIMRLNDVEYDLERLDVTSA